MNAGRLDHKIEILKNDKIRSELGNYTDNWSVFKIIWCEKNPALGNQYYAAQQNQSHGDIKFKTRYTLGIKKHMRIRDNEGLYDIIDVANPYTSNKELVIMCKEVIL